MNKKVENKKMKPFPKPITNIVPAPVVKGAASNKNSTGAKIDSEEIP